MIMVIILMTNWCIVQNKYIFPDIHECSNVGKEVKVGTKGNTEFDWSDNIK